MLHDYQIGTLKKWRRSRLFINLLPKMFFDMTRRLTALQRNYKSLLKNTTFLVVKISHLTFSLAALGMFQLIYPHSPLKTIFKIVLCAAKHKWEFFGHFSNSSGKLHSGISLRDLQSFIISMLFAQFKFNDPTIKSYHFGLVRSLFFCDLLPTKITIEKMHRFCLQISQGTLQHCQRPLTQFSSIRW